MILMYSRDEKKIAAIEGLCRGVGEVSTKVGPGRLKDTIAEIIASSGGANIKGLDGRPLKKSAEISAKISAGTSSKSLADRPVIPIMYNMPEVLIFAGVPEKKVDAFLDEYKKLGLEPISYKAVVTPTNISWSLYELIEQLACEHKQYADAQRAAGKRK